MPRGVNSPCACVVLSDEQSVPYFSEQRVGSRRLLPRLSQRDVLSEMYGEPARTVTRHLSEGKVSGSLGTCANCDEEGTTFRSDRSS